MIKVKHLWKNIKSFVILKKLKNKNQLKTRTVFFYG